MQRVTFNGGSEGAWRVLGQRTLRGAPIPAFPRLDVAAAAAMPAPEPAPVWTCDGLISHVRYATRQELSDLRARQEGLGRPAARHAALIPIQKSPDWWLLAQDERRRIFEETSQHTAIGLDYLPAIARQLYHARDIAQPFDFLTWFEFAPEDAPAFDELLARLRAREEWSYVVREVDIRLERA